MSQQDNAQHNKSQQGKVQHKKAHHIKRTSVRHNLQHEKDKESWELLYRFEDVGYQSLQAFIKDAIVHYYKWIKDGRQPYLRGDIKEGFKGWMREVLEEEQFVPGDRSVIKGKDEVASFYGEETTSNNVEIKEEIMSKATDFLSTL